MVTLLSAILCPNATEVRLALVIAARPIFIASAVHMTHPTGIVNYLAMRHAHSGSCPARQLCSIICNPRVLAGKSLMVTPSSGILFPNATEVHLALVVAGRSVLITSAVHLVRVVNCLALRHAHSGSRPVAIASIAAYSTAVFCSWTCCFASNCDVRGQWGRHAASPDIRQQTDSTHVWHTSSHVHVP